MKKFNLLIALTIFAGTVTVSPTITNAQDDKEAQKAEFERKWYDSCQTKKDDQCLPLSRELLDKYPSSTYAKFADQKLKNAQFKAVNDKFRAALEAYYKGPDAARLEQLFAAGEEYLKVQPGQQYVIGQLAYAGANGAVGQFYKNMDKVKSYGEQALRTFESATPPEGWKPEEWLPLRELVQAQVNQFLGYYVVETKGNPDDAIGYFTKATAVKNKDGAGWKDPNNYWLRSNIYSKKYDELRAQYDKLPDDQKTGDAGKELLKQVNQLLDTKLIPDYARVIAAANKPEAKPLLDAAKQLFDSFWKYRTDAPDKASTYLKAFEADPTVTGPAVPAKVETDTSMNAPTAPTTAGGANVKLSTGASGVAPGKQGTAANGNGSSKAAPTKGTKKPARKRK